jgi:hypothetical protein
MYIIADSDNNDVSDKGAVAIGTSLVELTYLNLSNINSRGAKITHIGANALAENLHKLTDLILRFNKIGDEGAIALSRLTTLTKLDIHNNEVGFEGMHAISNGLINLK